MEIFHGVGFLKKGNERVVCLRELELDYLGKEEELRQSGHGQEYKRPFLRKGQLQYWEKIQIYIFNILYNLKEVKDMCKTEVRYIFKEEFGPPDKNSIIYNILPERGTCEYRFIQKSTTEIIKQIKQCLYKIG